MTTSQLEQTLLAHAKELPREALIEAIDFIEFLKVKLSKKKSAKEYTIDFQISSSQTNHLEEEFANYKTKYQRE